ncbi:hypothetical protein [Burkholderia phage BCSR5]|nr:hypothetical protein [Burkholderia phage BCSR5]
MKFPVGIFDSMTNCLTKYATEGTISCIDTRTYKQVKYQGFYKGGPVLLDFEDEQAHVPSIDLLGRIEPSFGGYKRTVELEGIIFFGLWPMQRVKANEWLCSFDVAVLAANQIKEVGNE